MEPNSPSAETVVRAISEGMKSWTNAISSDPICQQIQEETYGGELNTALQSMDPARGPVKA